MNRNELIEKVADGLAARFRQVAGAQVAMPERAVWIGYANAALQAIAPMILAKQGGYLTTNEDADFVECVVGDRATVVCDLQGTTSAALIRDMGTREVIGVRVYRAAAIRAMKPPLPDHDGGGR